MNNSLKNDEVAELKKKARAINRKLKKRYPDAHCELNFKNATELLVATILSAQCTDVRVNIVTKELFKTYKKPSDYLQGSISKLEKAVQSTGFFRQKAKNIRAAMKIIVEQHGGEVPKTMEELNALPGVGRKTANVVLGNAFDIPGLPVDTHVTRLSNRLGIAEGKDAVKIEYRLNELLPPRDWTMFSHLLIWHGRNVCKARKPLCEDCELTKACGYYLEEHG